MKLTEDIVKKIEDEFESWENLNYAGKTLKERQKLRTVLYTPSFDCQNA